MDVPRRGALPASGRKGMGSARALAAILAGALLCVGVATSGAPAASPKPLAAASPGFFGVNTFPLPLATAQDARLMHRGGIRTVRFLINWNLVQPSPGTNQWGLTDRVFGWLARERIRPLPVVAGAPQWAVGSRPRPPITRLGKLAWSAFLKSVIARYGPGGAFWAAHPEFRPEPIRALQVWNEPNFPSMWGGPPSARGYAKLLRVSARAIRAASSGVKVVLAGLGPGLAKPNQVPSWKFLNKLYNAGAKPYFDVAADHPYAPDVAAMADQLRRVAEVMRRHRDHSPLYITELGWSSGHYPGSHLEVGLRGQAKRLKGAVEFVVRHRHKLHIHRFLWFQWRDTVPTGPQNPNGFFNFGLRRTNESPKPAWRAFARWTH